MAPKRHAKAITRQTSPPRQSSRRMAASRASQRAQEIHDRLLVVTRQQVEVVNHVVGFRSAARVLLDRSVDVAGAAVVQEEQTLADAPQRCGAELATIC